MLFHMNSSGEEGHTKLSNYAKIVVSKGSDHLTVQEINSTREGTKCMHAKVIYLPR